MSSTLFQRVRIEGKEICTKETLFLDKEEVTMPANDPVIPKGTYVELDFIYHIDSRQPVASIPGVVVHSGVNEMSVKLENWSIAYERLVELWEKPV